MRLRAHSALGLSVVALTLATSLAGTATADSGPSVAHKGTAKPVASPDGPVCFKSAIDDSGVGITSQNFEASFDAYDNQGADDLKIKADRACKVTRVTATGVYFNGSGPAVSQNVTIYKNSGGAPGAVKNTQTVTGTDTAGSFDMALSTVKLAAGKTFWISVQVNMDFGVGGQWGWETALTQKLNPAMWQNPGDGFGTGCTTYGDMVGCLGALGQGPDFMFSVRRA